MDTSSNELKGSGVPSGFHPKSKAKVKRAWVPYSDSEIDAIPDEAATHGIENPDEIANALNKRFHRNAGYEVRTGRYIHDRIVKYGLFKSDSYPWSIDDDITVMAAGVKGGDNWAAKVVKKLRIRSEPQILRRFDILSNAALWRYCCEEASTEWKLSRYLSWL
jgi:hypothetical protein